MKKTIVAVMVAASAVLSAQAMATNTAQVTVLGEVSDASNSCVVTPTGTLNNGIVQLITVTTTEANAEAAGKLFKTQDFGFEVKDCAQGSTNPVTGVTVNVSGTSSSDATILDNTAANGAAGIGIGICGLGVAAAGSQAQSHDGGQRKGKKLLFHRRDLLFKIDRGEITKSGSVTNGTQLKYTTGYVRTNAATPVTEGPVKGVATFTIDYTN